MRFPTPILGLTKQEARDEAARVAARRRARQRHHPDRPGGSTEGFLAVDREYEKVVEWARRNGHGEDDGLQVVQATRSNGRPDGWSPWAPPPTGPQWHEVHEVTCRVHEKAGRPDSIRMGYHTGEGTVTHFWVPRHGAWGRQRLAAHMAAVEGPEQTVRTLAARDAEAWEYVAQAWSWPKPERILCTQDGQWRRVVGWDYGPRGRVDVNGRALPEDA